MPLDWQGTRFQESVWQALLASTLRQDGDLRRCCQSYRQTALVSARRRCSGENPLPIIVPCHRVIGSDRSLTGFTGGLDIKIRLLELEGHSITNDHAFRVRNDGVFETLNRLLQAQFLFFNRCTRSWFCQGRD